MSNSEQNDREVKANLDRTGEGILYIAFGTFYLYQMIFSIESLRTYNPNFPIHVITNSDKVRNFAKKLDFSFKKLNLKDEENRIVKTALHRYTPFYKTLYLDCDTVISNRIHRIFYLLSHYDLVIRTEASPTSNTWREDDPIASKELIEAYGEFNCGVFAFAACPSVIKFMDSWASLNAERKTVRDQRTFTEALSSNLGINIYPLPPTFNYTRYDYENSPIQNQIVNPVIFHYMQLPYSPDACNAVLRMCIEDKAIRRIGNYNFFWRQFVLPWLCRNLFGFKKIYLSSARFRRFAIKHMEKKLSRKIPR